MAFKLEALLKLRKNEENEELKRFAEINKHLIKQKDQLRVNQETKKENFQSLDKHIRENPKTKILWLYNNFFEGSFYQEKLSKEVISEVEEKLDSQRKELTEAMRKRKILELLKERQAQVLRKKIFKQELDSLDESASNSWERTRQ
tara:strand:- start:558 stop:995 length:438 start_codon:yes stop_codon:yes gene_type:complete